MQDYQEALTGGNPTLSARQVKQRPIFFGLRPGIPNSIPANRRGTGNYLNPQGRGEQWTYEKNQAFWAGGIDAGRSFVLITPLENSAIGTIRNRYTGDEMLWLLDNGYRFEFLPRTNGTRNPDAIVAIPPQNRSTQAVIRDYRPNIGVETRNARMQKLEPLLADLTQRRNVLLTQNQTQNQHTPQQTFGQ